MDGVRLASLSQVSPLSVSLSNFAGQGRRFRGRRNRQTPVEEGNGAANAPANEGEVPANGEMTGATAGKMGPRRRGNYYNRRFRRQSKTEQKHEDGAENEVRMA